MPTETFLRLPEKKRERFVAAAWEEFLRVPFEEASINKIVLKARIPRGSFYQYFADKKDLFYYLVGDMIEDYFISMNNRNVGSTISLVMLALIIFSIGLLRRVDPNNEGGGLW